MPYFTCIFKNQDSDEQFVDTTHDLRTTLHELRSVCKLKLLYYEHFTNASSAIDRHTQLKQVTQEKLSDMIKMSNPEMEDLALLL